MKRKERNGRKGRICKRLVVFNSIAFLLLIPNALAINSLIANDRTQDLLQFDRDFLDELGEDIYDFEDFEDIKEAEFIDQSNEFYDQINSNREEAEVIEKPKYIDIEAITFDSEENELKISMVDKIRLEDDESLIGFIWTSENCYIFILIGDNGIYVEPNSDNYTNIEIDERDLVFETVSHDFDNEDYVKCIIIYSSEEDEDVYVVETFYDLETRDTLIFWFIIALFVALLIILIIILYLRHKKLNEV